MNQANSGLPNTQGPSDDEVYENSPLQFTADRMGKLVRIAERDPKKQVVIPLDTMNKLYMAYLGVLEIYQQQTAAGVVIDGERHICSIELQRAITPVIEQNRRIKAEQDVDREMAAQRSKSQSADAGPPPIRPR